MGQVPDLPNYVFRRARPRPQFGSPYQPGPHWIPFDISDDTLKFLAVAHPVVIGFVLPKPQTGSTQDEIGFPCPGVLHCARHLRSGLWGCNRTCKWFDITTHAKSSYNPHFLPAMYNVSATEAATCGCLRKVGPESAESSCRSSRRNLRPSGANQIPWRDWHTAGSHIDAKSRIWELPQVANAATYGDRSS